MTHEVIVLCQCTDIEQCRTERYVNDVRLAYAEIQRLISTLETIWRQTREVLQAA